MPGKITLPPFIIWKHILPGPDIPQRMYAVIECPKGSQVKYELSKTTNLLLLNRVLHSSVIYPQDYGFIPGTLAEDGDPLDIMVLISHPTFPRTLVECKPVGVLIMADEQGIDNKVLAAAIHDPFFSDYNTIDELPRHVMDELHEFFRTYKNLENPKYSDVKEWKGPDEAYNVINKNIADFQEKFGDIACVDPMAGLDEF